MPYSYEFQSCTTHIYFHYPTLSDEVEQVPLDFALRFWRGQHLEYRNQILGLIRGYVLNETLELYTPEGTADTLVIKATYPTSNLYNLTKVLRASRYKLPAREVEDFKANKDYL